MIWRGALTGALLPASFGRIAAARTQHLRNPESHGSGCDSPGKDESGRRGSAET